VLLLAIAQAIGLGMLYSNYANLLVQIFPTQQEFPRHLLSANAFLDLFGALCSMNVFVPILCSRVMVFVFASVIFTMSQLRISV
jgi:hypothetical protein